MNSIYTHDYQNERIVPILKEYSAKKYGRKREFVDAEMNAKLGISAEEAQLPEVPVDAPEPPAAPQAIETAPAEKPAAATEVSPEKVGKAPVPEATT